MNARGFEWIEPYLCTKITRRIARKIYLKTALALQVAKYHTKEKPNAVFLWIPKNAGTSIYSVLMKYGCIKYKSAEAVKYAFPNRGLVTFCHMSYIELLNRGFINKVYDKYANKFCFVRNPYIRAVSLYEYLKKTNKVDRRISFETFCHILKDGAFEPPNLVNTDGINQCNKQVAWIKNKNGEIFVDFIGRVESLHQDCSRLFNTLNIRETIPNLNRGAYSNWRLYYNRVTKFIVKMVYEEDFELLRYSYNL
jgi:hypothetical protein